MSGQRGFIAYLKLNKELKNKTFELNALTKQREVLESKVKLLYPKTLDLDLIDEIARKDMGLIEADEHLIMLEQKD
jgi:cell division protein FtsB